jgi:hypothetical protein
MSSTANAGGRARTAVRASATDSTSVVSKPRLSSARPRRLRNGPSSSSSSRLFSERLEMVVSMLDMDARHPFATPKLSTSAWCDILSAM